MLFFHFSSRHAWEVFADVGATMVVFGVVGEGAEIVIKLLKRKCKQLREWREKHDLIVDIWEIGAWALVVLGLVLEIEGTGKARIFADAENTQLKTEAAQARSAASLANERAEEAKTLGKSIEKTNSTLALELERGRSNNLVLTVKAESLEIARAEIERQAAPRHLSPAQAWRLTSELAKYAPNSVVVLSSAPDEESADFADDLEDVLTTAKWKVSRIDGELPRLPRTSSPLLARVDPEITLWRPRATRLRGLLVAHSVQVPSRTAEVLISALRQVLEARIMDFQNICPTDQVCLIVAPKPPFGSERSDVPRSFQPSPEALERLARFSWTNAIVVSDPKDQVDAAFLAAQIEKALPGCVVAYSNPPPWLHGNTLAFGPSVGVTVAVGLLGRSEQQNGLYNEQALALETELKNVGVFARRTSNRPHMPQGWITITVGANPSLEQSRTLEWSDFWETNVFRYPSQSR